MGLKRKQSVVSDEASKIGRMKRNKGASYEREIAHLLRRITGVEFVRTPLSGGFMKRSDVAEDFRGDIIPLDRDNIFKLHLELKSHKKLSIPAWWKQTEEDCPKNKMPVLIFHLFGSSKNLIALDVNDFFDLVDVKKIVKRRK